MKNILLATTALVMTAGLASAEVALSGDARMGIQKVEGNDATVERRARVKFSLSGETDSGLSFGASFRSHLNATDGNDTNVGNVYIKSAFGTLSVGSESSAAEYAVGDLAGVGFTGAGSKNENKFIGGGSVVYTYSVDAFTGMISVGETAGMGGNKLDSDSASIGVKYAAGDLTLGLGYEDSAASSHVIGGVTYQMGDTTFKATYGRASAIDFTQAGVSVAHSMGDVSMAAFYRNTDTSGVSADFYGVGAGYNLGGGASVNAGFASNDGVSTIEAGIKMSF